MATLTPLEEGKKAFRDDISMSQNPYDKYSDEWCWWNLGWKDEWWDEGKNTWRPQ